MNGAGENTPATVVDISRLLFAQPAAPARTSCRLSQPPRPGQLIFRGQITPVPPVAQDPAATLTGPGSRVRNRRDVPTRRREPSQRHIATVPLTMHEPESRTPCLPRLRACRGPCL